MVLIQEFTKWETKLVHECKNVDWGQNLVFLLKLNRQKLIMGP